MRRVLRQEFTSALVRRLLLSEKRGLSGSGRVSCENFLYAVTGQMKELAGNSSTRTELSFSANSLGSGTATTKYDICCWFRVSCLQVTWEPNNVLFGRYAPFCSASKSADLRGYIYCGLVKSNILT